MLSSLLVFDRCVRWDKDVAELDDAADEAKDDDDVGVSIDNAAAVAADEDEEEDDDDEAEFVDDKDEEDDKATTLYDVEVAVDNDGERADDNDDDDDDEEEEDEEEEEGAIGSDVGEEDEVGCLIEVDACVCSTETEATGVSTNDANLSTWRATLLVINISPRCWGVCWAASDWSRIVKEFR